MSYSLCRSQILMSTVISDPSFFNSFIFSIGIRVDVTTLDGKKSVGLLTHQDLEKR